MKALVDLHSHTIASGHAYSTWSENVKAAKEHGLKVVGISEHAVMMPGTVKEIYFTNFKVLPRMVNGVIALNGIEANIYNYNGAIDVSDNLYSYLDYIIASLHSPCIKGGTVEQNTNALIGAMKNPYVKIIGHPDDDRYPVDYDQIACAASEYGVALEFNNSSLNPRSTRINGRNNIIRMLEKAKQYHTMILMGTDSHMYTDIGIFTPSYDILKEVNFPEELIINFDLKKLPLVLNKQIDELRE